MGQVVDEDGNDTNSDLSSSEDHKCLDSFEEITEQSELKLFSIFLKKAQGVTSEKKICDDLISKGFLPIDQFMKRMKKRKFTISDSEPPSSCSVSGSGVSAQACAFQEEEEESNPGLQELPSPYSISGGSRGASSHASVHTLQEEEEESDVSSQEAECYAPVGARARRWQFEVRVRVKQH
ncbi:hypothetical protein BC827DRAFT_1273089 [Russula dissimulans]|nr:hypothetical protein BC827DRAFT_1273089 [Russula dissimulans]